MNGIIYVTRCLVNGKVYVGLHTRGRHDYLGSGTVLLHAIKKYGRERFVREDIDVFFDLEDGREKEKQWISIYNSKSPNGYNLCDGGEGMVNPCQETRDKMRKSRQAFFLTPEGKIHLERLRIINLGRHPSDDTKEKMRRRMYGNTWGQALRGRPKSALTRARMSVAQTGNKKFLGHRHSEETKAKITGRPPRPHESQNEGA